MRSPRADEESNPTLKKHSAYSLRASSEWSWMLQTLFALKPKAKTSFKSSSSESFSGLLYHTVVLLAKSSVLVRPSMLMHMLSFDASFRCSSTSVTNLRIFRATLGWV